MKRIIVILLSLMPLLMFAKGDKDARVIIITIDGPVSYTHLTLPTTPYV